MIEREVLCEIYNSLGINRIYLCSFITFNQDPIEMADQNSAKSKRTAAKGQFTRAENKLWTAVKTCDEEIPLSTVKRRFSELELKWHESQDAHDTYLSFIEDTADAEQLEAEEKWIEELSVRFGKIEVATDKYIEERSQVKPSVKSAEVPNVVSQASVVRFERMKFPPFGGNIRKYPLFREEFIKHIEPQCGKDQLAFVLKSYLTEEVQEEVENVGDDYLKMWRRLDQKYGNTGKLIDAILFEIKNLSYGNADPCSTLQMIKVVEKAYRDLQRLGEEAEMCNATTISIIEERLPVHIKSEWVKLIASKQLNSRQKFTALMNLLEDWRNRLEYVSDNIRVLPDHRGLVNFLGEQQNSNSYISTGGAGGLRRIHRCWLHKLVGEAGEHPIWKCRDFLSKNVQDGMQTIIKNNACQVCLLTECAGVNSPVDCKSRFRCREDGCGLNHNRLLHAKLEVSGINAHTTDGTTILPIQTL